MKKERIGVIKVELAVIFLLFSFNTLTTEAQEAASDIIINEIMSTATNQRADYVEIYNRGDIAIDLSTLRIGYIASSGKTRTTRMSDESRIIMPGDYYVITRDANAVSEAFSPADETAIGESDHFPTLAAEGTVVLLDADSIGMDSVAYKEAWHHPLLTSHKDVALERIDADSPSNDASNWTSALASAGHATPSSRNSVARTENRRASDGAQISIASRTICPRGDGSKAPTTMKVTIKSGHDIAAASMTIFDAEGRLVARPADNMPVATGAETMTWDGRDSSGRIVGPRTYIVLVETWEAGGESERRKETITVIER